MTNTFSTPILARAYWQLAYTVKNYGRASVEICELIVEGNRTAQSVYLDHERNFVAV